MSQDIRSFFAKAGKSQNKNSQITEKKTKRTISLSDDDDFIPATPAVVKKTLNKKRKIVDSDDENSENSKNKPESKAKKETEVKAVDIFGKEPIKRSKIDKLNVKKSPLKTTIAKNNVTEEEGSVHNDEAFKLTLKQEDENLKKLEKIVEANKSPNKKPNRKLECSTSVSYKKESKSPKHDTKNISNEHSKINDDRKKSPLKKSQNDFDSVPKKESPKPKLKRDFAEFIDCENVTPEKPLKSPRSAKKSKKEKSPELTEEERRERKLHSAALYKSYLNRTGPKNPGSKEVPEGKPNCLSGLSFLITGELESLERNEISDIIKKYGGEVKNTVTGKVSYVIHGDNSGPSKLAKAEKLNIPLLTEDEFLQLIKTQSSDEKSKSHQSESANKSKNKKTPAKKVSSEVQNGKKEKKITPVKMAEPEQNCSKSQKTVELKLKKEILQEDEPKSNSEKFTTIHDCNITWVDKYKPQNLKAIIGQQGDASCASKLVKWLSDWYKNRKLKLPKPTPWSKGDGGYYKTALLSGPPGIGKTTTVSLVCKQLGFDIVEYNASDTRSKTLLADKLSTQMSTTSLMPYFQGKTGKGAVTKKHVIIMDEVDGMAGNEDRGGMQELIMMAKQTSVPIICMCNDKTSSKMRSFLNYVYDIPFPKPKIEQIKAAMRSICFKEGINIPVNSLHDLIVGANQDIRQTINLLSLWSASGKKSSSEDMSHCSTKKDIKMGPWDVIRKVFSEEEHKKMSIHDKSDLFFYDYSLGPLFVQQNYLKVVPHCPKNQFLDKYAEAAECLSTGDLVESKIRGNMAWSLLPTQAMFSSVLPGSALSGHISGQIDFPSWLGQNSKRNKLHRLVQELHSHTSLSTSGNKEAMKLDYAPHLRDAVLRPLIKQGSEGIQEAIDLLQSYHLLREDLDSLIELTQWSNKKDLSAMIDSKIKAAFTRTYKKQAVPLPYSQVSTKKSRANDNILGEDGTLPASDEELEDETSDLENDPMIKVSKKKNVPIKSETTKVKKGKETNRKSKK